jgi:signal transduction histidine kinase
LIVGVGVGGLITAGLGWWATSRALRPLSRFTQVAHEVASGDLDQRLPATHDRDLAPLAEAFNSTVTRLQRRVVRDARFASDVSHELRSPVTTMINAMAVLRHRRGELSPTAARALDLLDDDLGRFERMISDLLEISLSDQGAHQPEMQPVDLHEVVRGVSRARAIPDESIFAFGSGPVVLAERRRLERAIDNVLANAEKHGQGVVRVAVWEDAARAVVEIDDRGPGVPIDARERIFERFTRIPATEATEGTGLGLALVADHIRLYSGRAWVTDAPGGGARFVIELRKAR